MTVPNIAGQLWGTQHANRALDAEIANNEANRRQRDQQFYTQLFAGPAMQTGFGLLGSYVKELMPTEAQAREIQKYGFDRAKKSDNRTDFLTDVLASYGATRTGPKGAMEVNVGEPVQAGAVPAPVAPKVETPNSFTDGSAPSLDMLGKQSSVFDPSRYSLRGSASVTPALGGLDGLVNNASSFYSTTVGDIQPADWDDLAGTNLKAPGRAHLPLPYWP